jgi:hypothetical protein
MSLTTDFVQLGASIREDNVIGPKIKLSMRDICRNVINGQHHAAGILLEEDGRDDNIAAAAAAAEDTDVAEAETPTTLACPINLIVTTSTCGT